MLHLPEIRKFLYASAPRGQWVSLQDLYALVEAKHSFDSEDLRPVSDRHPEPRWQRNVRAVLQEVKQRDVEWKRPAQYRFLSAAQTELSGDGDDAQLADELVGLEGEARYRVVVHRKRERRLRDAKIEQALKSGGGRLRCQVPGCAFDFQEVYGNLGRGYAQVHHLRRLSDVEDITSTSLAELAVVCANCHAMIHLNGENRSLDALISGRQTRTTDRATPKASRRKAK